MKTWRLQSNEPIQIKLMAMALQTAIGPESMALDQRQETGIWQWTASSSGENENEMQEHQDFIRFNKGAKFFWFDGSSVQRIKSRVFVGTGNGVRTQWQMPYRWICESSLVISVNYATNTNWTLSGKGIIFGSAPADGALIHIEECIVRFKCFMVVDNNTLYELTDAYKSYSSQNMVIQEYAD